MLNSRRTQQGGINKAVRNLFFFFSWEKTESFFLFTKRFVLLWFFFTVKGFVVVSNDPPIALPTRPPPLSLFSHTRRQVGPRFRLHRLNN